MRKIKKTNKKNLIDEKNIAKASGGGNFSFGKIGGNVTAIDENREINSRDIKDVTATGNIDISLT